MVKFLVKLMKSGKSYVVEEELETIKELKWHLERCHGIPFNDQILVHNNKFTDFNGTKLDDLLKISARIKVYTKISPQTIGVEVVFRKHDVLYLNVDSYESVLHLKMMIDEKLGLSPHRQRLIKGSDVMYESDVLDEYIIEKTPTFKLEEIPVDTDQILHIRVEKNGLFTMIELENSDSIYTLHGEARRKGLAEGYRFYFLWGGKRLLGQNNFACYGIPDGSTVLLVEEEDEDGEDYDEDEEDYDEDEDGR